MLLVFTVIQPDLGFLLMMSVALQYNVFLIFTFSMLGTELTEAVSFEQSNHPDKAGTVNEHERCIFSESVRLGRRIFDSLV